MEVIDALVKKYKMRIALENAEGKAKKLIGSLNFQNARTLPTLISARSTISTREKEMKFRNIHTNKIFYGQFVIFSTSLIQASTLESVM